MFMSSFAFLFAYSLTFVISVELQVGHTTAGQVQESGITDTSCCSVFRLARLWFDSLGRLRFFTLFIQGYKI